MSMLRPSRSSLLPATAPAVGDAWRQRLSPPVNLCWRGVNPPGWIEPERRLYDHMLGLVEDGAFTIRLAGQQLQVPAGGWFILPPDLVHVGMVAGKASRRVCVHFDWEPTGGGQIPYCVYLPGRLRAEWVRPAPAWAPGGFRQGPVARPRMVETVLDGMFRRWQSRDPVERPAARASMLELMLLLLAEGAVRPARAEDLALRAKEVLEAAVPDPDASVQPLLAGLGVSYEHAARSFAAAFGMAPVKYLAAARVARAGELLRQPGARVAAVAAQAGFRDPAYFARVFRAHTGGSPRRAGADPTG